MGLAGSVGRTVLDRVGRTGLVGSERWGCCCLVAGCCCRCSLLPVPPLLLFVALVAPHTNRHPCGPARACCAPLLTPLRPSLLQPCMRLLRSLFYNMALGKFLDVQAAFGASGLHAKLVDASLDLLRGPSAMPVQVRKVCGCGTAAARQRHPHRSSVVAVPAQSVSPTSTKQCISPQLDPDAQQELAAELCLQFVTDQFINHSFT